jgi:hypothetical protein
LQGRIQAERVGRDFLPRVTGLSSGRDALLGKLANNRRIDFCALENEMKARPATKRRNPHLWTTAAAGCRAGPINRRSARGPRQKDIYGMRRD